jgi:diaminopimelate epimerase
MSGTLAIWKMTGAGNDFVVLDAAGRGAIRGDFSEWVRRVCRRGLSVGADGVLVVGVLGPDRVRVEFYNPDGGDAFCGNGSRCAARFARERGFAGSSMTLVTAAGEVLARVYGERVRLTLPPPRDLGVLTLELPGRVLSGRRIDAGSPHFVARVDDVAAYPLDVVGPLVRRHDAFGARGTNFDVVATASEGISRLRTWERGVEAETLACGSGAVATAYALLLAGGSASTRLVTAGGAALEVTIEGPPEHPRAATLDGDARFVFAGQLADEALRF